MARDYWRLPFDKSPDVVVIGSERRQIGVFVPGVLAADWTVPWIVEDAQDALDALDSDHACYLPQLAEVLIAATSPQALLVWSARAIRRIEADGPVMKKVREQMVEPLAQVVACETLSPSERLQAFDLLLWLDPAGQAASWAYDSLRSSRNLACRYCSFGRWFHRQAA